LLDIVQSNQLHWRFGLMASNFLDVLARPEAAPTSELADYAAKSLISELPALRRIAISMTTRLLFHIKQRTYSVGDLELIALSKEENPLKRKVRTPDPLPTGYTEDYLASALTLIDPKNAANVYVFATRFLSVLLLY
jgi:hypothetical protein